MAFGSITKSLLLCLVIFSLNNFSSAVRLLGNDTLLDPNNNLFRGEKVTFDSKGITIHGQKRLILSGSIHYPRSTPNMWKDLIQKAKDGGLNTIETYVFWSSHEPQYRQYDFTGNNDLVRFIKTIQDVGMYAILRIGPYVCAEWSFGGLPVWLHNLPNIKFRTVNEPFQNEMKIFTTLIVNMMIKENLFASQGGPIILAQIENEYGNIMWNYNEAGKQYEKWCADLAESYNVQVPWIMCQQGDAPEPIINTCNGYYCDQWKPNNANSPKLFTENWAGWFKKWGGADPHRTAEDLAFSVARFFQYEGVGNNYYMYHGGTNFGRTAGGPYITTSYDYDAPLDEYGNLNQPKWGHLKQLHELLLSAEEILVNGVREHQEFGDLLTGTVVTYKGKSFCFIGNAHESRNRTINFLGQKYMIPAWSSSILPDCYKEAYNTAKVNTQTWVMTKLPNRADERVGEPYALKWSWRDEHIHEIEDDGSVQGSDFTANELIDQKFFNDTSDYAYYMTTVVLKENDPLLGKNTILHVHTNGKVVHAFVNGKFVGTQIALNNEDHFIYEQKVQFVKGLNKIVLISGLVGYQNYGAFYDEGRNGIYGPVKLIATPDNDAAVTIDISSNKWIYKNGLAGERAKLFDPSFGDGNWKTDDLPINTNFIWYKTTFPTPLGTDPVVVDLMGLSKGMAWVNGYNIGRYWPSFKAPDTACSVDKCDYRGAYYSDKCQDNCGNPSQRWYHVPRDYLNSHGDNVLVLFEEFGGTPSNVIFQTVTVGRACGNAQRGAPLELSCQGGRTFTDIKFASFGQPEGECQSFRVGSCEAANTMSIVRKACIGKTSCSFDVSEVTFGNTGCEDLNNLRLAIEAIC